MATSQDVIAFKAQMPAFAQVNDADIAAVLNTAGLVVVNDGTWSPIDYPAALRYYAAWLLSLIQEQAANATITGSGVTDLYVRSIRFGERDVTFAQRTALSNIERTSGPGEALLNVNVWGNMYLQLRYRNVVPVMVI